MDSFGIDQFFDLLSIVICGASEEDDVVVMRDCLDELTEKRPETHVELMRIRLPLFLVTRSRR